MKSYSGIESVLDNKIFRYRVNGLAVVCKMDELNENKRKSGDIQILSGNCKNERDILAGKYDFGKNIPRYYITVRPVEDEEYGSGISFAGHYAELAFTFINFLNGNSNQSGLNSLDLPFSISLSKIVDEDNYIFEIQSVKGMDELAFKITKYREYRSHLVNSVCEFYHKVDNFDDILRILKYFNYNPEDTYLKCRDKYDKKKQRVIFEASELDDVMMSDENISGPVKTK